MVIRVADVKNEATLLELDRKEDVPLEKQLQDAAKFAVRHLLAKYERVPTIEYGEDESHYIRMWVNEAQIVIGLYDQETAK